MSKKLNTEKTLKVYNVVFASFYHGEDISRVDSKNVLSETAEGAIREAELRINTKERQTYYVESVEMLFILD